MVMNIGFSQNAENFLTSCWTVRFWTRILLYEL